MFDLSTVICDYDIALRFLVVTSLAVLSTVAFGAFMGLRKASARCRLEQDACDQAERALAAQRTCHRRDVRRIAEETVDIVERVNRLGALMFETRQIMKAKREEGEGLLASNDEAGDRLSSIFSNVAMFESSIAEKVAALQLETEEIETAVDGLALQNSERRRELMDQQWENERDVALAQQRTEDSIVRAKEALARREAHRVDEPVAEASAAGEKVLRAVQVQAQLDNLSRTSDAVAEELRRVWHDNVAQLQERVKVNAAALDQLNAEINAMHERDDLVDVCAQLVGKNAELTADAEELENDVWEQSASRARERSPSTDDDVVPVPTS